MLSYTMYSTIDPATVPPIIEIEERGRRRHNQQTTDSNPSSAHTSDNEEDEEEDHIEPLRSTSRRGSILNYVYGLSAPSSRSNSRTRSRSRSRPNIKIQDAPDALLLSIANAVPAASTSPRQSTNNSRRSSMELKTDYAEILEERSRPSSRVNSRSNSRTREPYVHFHPHAHDDKDHKKEEKELCGNDCATCGTCGTVKDTVLELDTDTPSKIQKKLNQHISHHAHKHPRRKSIEVTGPYTSTIEVQQEDEDPEESKDGQTKDGVTPVAAPESIERKLGFDMSLLSF
ncbi:hypothetical protein FBU30_002876 [Linnemannia zychae]|nr:hypothetical protein FBU30_002876 [Linnemannia zychae]